MTTRPIGIKTITIKHIFALAAIGLFVAGCGDDSGSEEEEAVSGGGGSGGASSSSLSLSGSPPSQILIDTQFVFSPTVSNPNNVALSFSADNLPVWAQLNASTGRITGTPSAGDVGVYSGLRLTASGGGESATLGPYTVEVVAVGSGRATLTWTAPTQRVDGSALTNLAGFRIYYGQSQNNLNRSITIDNASISTYIVENLTPATWYFAATAYDSDGFESGYSNIATKTIL